MHLPHLKPFNKKPLLFITVCTAGRRPLLTGNGTKQILEGIWIKSAALDGWFVGHDLLMPDHLHLFAQPVLTAQPLANWVKSWKSISSRRIAVTIRIKPPVWQADYFDHFVRTLDAYREKWDYVKNNPVRQGLCRRSTDWVDQGTLHDLRFE